MIDEGGETSAKVLAPAPGAHAPGAGESGDVHEEQGGVTEKPSSGRSATRFLAHIGVPLFLVLLFVGFSFASSSFFTISNVRTILSSQSAILMIALAATIPLRAGMFDFSLASIMIFSGTLMASLASSDHLGAGLAAIIAILAACAAGAVNAGVAAYIGVDSFVVTVGMSSILSGVAYALAGGEVLSNIPSSVEKLSRVDIFSIPSAVFIGWLVAVLLWLLYEFTPLGTNFLYVGGSRRAAELAGLNVRRTQAVAFILAAAIAGFAGVVLTGTLGAVDPTSYSSYLLQPFAAAFLGAAAIQLGRFNVWGTVIGLYLVAVGETGLELLGAAPWIADVFNGVILMAAVSFAKVMERART